MATISILHIFIGFASGMAFASLFQKVENYKLQKTLDAAINNKFKQDLEIDELNAQIEILEEKNEQLEHSVNNAIKALTSTYTILPPPSPTLERQGGPYYNSPDSPLSFTLDESSKD